MTASSLVAWLIWVLVERDERAFRFLLLFEPWLAGLMVDGKFIGGGSL